jgi:hypothetical protein
MGVMRAAYGGAGSFCVCFFYQLLACIHSFHGSAFRSGYSAHSSEYFADYRGVFFAMGDQRYRVGVTDSVLGIWDP